MQPIPYLITLRPLYLILKHANPKKGRGPHFLEKAAITNLNTWGPHPPPPRGLSLTLLLLIVLGAFFCKLWS